MSAFDHSAFSSLIDGDKELFAELLRLYRADWPDLIKVINDSVYKSNAQQAEVAAHRLKGMVKNFFASRAAELAGAVEDLARDGHIQSIPKCIPNLEAELINLEKELDQHLTKI